MKFVGCSFQHCRKYDFECCSCPCFDKDGVSSCVDPIHPILKVPMSKVPTD